MKLVTGSLAQDIVARGSHQRVVDVLNVNGQPMALVSVKAPGKYDGAALRKLRADRGVGAVPLQSQPLPKLTTR